MFRIRTAGGAFSEPAALGEPPILKPAPGTGPQIEFHRGSPTAAIARPNPPQAPRPRFADTKEDAGSRRPCPSAAKTDIGKSITYTAIFSLSLQRTLQRTFRAARQASRRAGSVRGEFKGMQYD